MNFLRKHLLGVVYLSLAVTCFGLYLFLVRPVMVRRQAVVEAAELKIAQLRRYRNDPPSAEMIVRLTREKEMLENQYKEVIKTLNFAQRVPLPEEIGKPHLYFEEQVEREEKELGRLEEMTGIKVPDRLGFKKERPQSREELSALLSQLTSARELISLVTKSKVSNLSVFKPLPFLPEGVKVDEEGRFPAFPVAGDRSNEFLPAELKFELGVRAEISTLANLLYRLANYSYFFTVKDLEIKSVVGEGKETSFIEEEQDRQGRRRRGRVASGNLLRKKLEKKEKTANEVELEAKLLISTRLLLSTEE